MTNTGFDNIRVIRRDEKHETLAAFVAQSVTAALRTATGSLSLDIIARSMASPVVVATAHALAQLDTAAIDVRIVVKSDNNGFANAAMDGHTMAVRKLSNPALSDAHEQLIVGTDAVWIGDTMRRDPNCCDSFERYVETGDQAIAWAAKAFARLWDMSHEIAARHDGVSDFHGFDAGFFEGPRAATVLRSDMGD